MVFLVTFLLIFTFQSNEIDQEMILGKWKVVKVEYLDRQPVRDPDGTQLVFEFKRDGTCINHFHNSSSQYKLTENQLDMAGYSSTIEKLTDQELVFRENKQFFLRRFHCKRIK